jgi:hypothetical protein
VVVRKTLAACRILSSAGKQGAWSALFRPCADLDLLVAAIARWPVAFIARNNPVDGLVSDVSLLLVIAYDYWSTRKIDRVTLFGGRSWPSHNKSTARSARRPPGTSWPTGSSPSSPDFARSIVKYSAGLLSQPVGGALSSEIDRPSVDGGGLQTRQAPKATND